MKEPAIFSFLTEARRLRASLLVGFFLLLMFLISQSPLRKTGDAQDYMALALNLSRFEPPALSDQQIVWTEQRFNQIEDGYQGLRLRPYMVRSLKAGRSDFQHFWFYSALAVPPMWLSEALGLSPDFAFTLLNLTLLLAAFWVVSGKLDVFFTLFLFGSPILWWVDKAQVEVFTFSFLAMAFALLADQPWWSMVLFGAAATQNPPIAFGVVFAVLATLASRGKEALRDKRMWAGGIAASVLALLNPLYFYVHVGVVLPIIKGGGAIVHWPSLGEAGAFIFDPNIGLLANFPLLAPVLVTVLVALLLKNRVRLRSLGIWAAMATGLVFLFAFSQTLNFNHGGTPHMSRYDLWLIPLAVPLLLQADRAFGPTTRRWIAPVAVISCAVSIVHAQPRLPEDCFHPTPLARYLWARHPSLDNPLPEVFVERLRQEDAGFWETYGKQGCKAALAYLPTATPSCSKILLIGHEPVPLPCAIPSLPQACQKFAAFCYANRSGDNYRFTTPPMGQIQRFISRVVTSPSYAGQCGP
jgi:hypothetical protein